MLRHMQVKHPLDQRALKPGSSPFKHIESAAREFDPALKVQDPKLRAQIPVGLQLEVGLTQLAFPLSARRFHFHPPQSARLHAED